MLWNKKKRYGNEEWNWEGYRIKRSFSGLFIAIEISVSKISKRIKEAFQIRRSFSGLFIAIEISVSKISERIGMSFPGEER